jgi:hypothetical protein
MTRKEKNNDIMINNQNKLRDLEQFYNENKVDTMLDTIQAKKQEICDEISQYASDNLKPCKWDKDGEPIEFKVNIKPIVINNYFFKSIVPLGNVEPIYNAEKLSMVFDYYCDILAEVNDKIGDFPSSLTSFCKLAGITLSTLRSYKNSQDLSMRVVVEKIYDQIGDINISMSQLGIVKERTTLFKMKSENELVEKQQTIVNINITEKVDMEQINNRIDKYKVFATKKGNK